MNEITLERFAWTDQATFGKLSLPDGSTLFTVERPWLDNTPNLSCIPVGVYKCRPRPYNRGGYDAVEVTNVPGRSYILFHIGNFVRDSQGCILVNSELGAINNEWCGLGSKPGFKHFMNVVGGSEFTLNIVNKRI